MSCTATLSTSTEHACEAATIFGVGNSWCNKASACDGVRHIYVHTLECGGEPDYCYVEDGMPHHGTADHGANWRDDTEGATPSLKVS